MLDLRILVFLIALALCIAGCAQTPADVNNAGHGSFLGGDYASALEQYERAAERDPGAAEPIYNTGNTLYRMEEFRESVRRYDEALRDAKGELRSSGFFNRGNASFQMRLYAEAVEAYKEVLRINPDDADAKHNLELALLQIPTQAQAQAQQEDAQQQDQAQDEASQNQARDQASQNQDQSEQAQDAAPEPSMQSQEERQDEQSREEREQGQSQEDSRETPPAGEVSMSEAGARQVLESVGEEAQTLQERRGQVLVSPNPPSEYDW